VSRGLRGTTALGSTTARVHPDTHAPSSSRTAAPRRRRFPPGLIGRRVGANSTVNVILRVRHLEGAAEALGARVAAMEASRLWKPGRRWRRVTRTLGLNADTDA
jgi:hypothetical protein